MVYHAFETELENRANNPMEGYRSGVKRWIEWLGGL